MIPKFSPTEKQEKEQSSGSFDELHDAGYRIVLLSLNSAASFEVTRFFDCFPLGNVPNSNTLKT